MKRHFASDNQAGVCPEAWDAIARANAEGHAPSYGEDPWTQRAADLVRELFESDCDVYFVFNGTAANALALSTVGRGYNAVICSENAHIETSECGAVQFFSGGMKHLTCKGNKVTLANVDRILAQEKDPHVAEPRALSVTQATEAGTLYQLDELKALTSRAKSAGLRVHMDGARFSNAVASLGCSPAEASWKAGVDVLCFGGTKNGMMLSEAIVFFDRTVSRDFGNACLQGGQLASKMRFATAQWVAMLETGAWIRHATHANAMAKRLETGLRTVTGVSIVNPVESNAVFADVAPEVQIAVRARGWNFFEWDGVRNVRLMCAWDTTTEDVDQFVEALKEASTRPPF